MLYISYFFDDVRICLFSLGHCVCSALRLWWRWLYIQKECTREWLWRRIWILRLRKTIYHTIYYCYIISSIVMNVKTHTHTIQSTILNMYLWPCVVPLSYSCFERHKLYVLCTYIHHLPPNHCIHFCIVLRDSNHSNNKKKSLGEESIFVWKEVYIWNYIQISSMIREITIWIFPRL